MVKYKFIGAMPKYTDTIGVTAPDEIVDLNEEQAEIADYSPEFVKVQSQPAGRPKTPKTKGDD